MAGADRCKLRNCSRLQLFLTPYSQLGTNFALDRRHLTAALQYGSGRMIRSGDLECREPESVLPQTQPLRWTQNFMWIVLLCMLSLQMVPLLVAWVASELLK